MRSFLARLRALFRKEKLDRDLSEELSEHLQLRIERNLEAGMSPEEARYAAMRAFGGVEQIKERCRDERTFVWGEQLLQDMRYGLRSLRKSPGFATVAVLTLALGIGATTTMFSVIYNVLIAPFPYREAERVVMLQIRNAERPNQSGRSSFETPQFLDYVEQSTVFAEVIAGSMDNVLFAQPEGTQQMMSGLVSGNQFSFLGVPAVLGRTLTPEDGKPGAPAVCVLGHKGWQKFFGLDPGVVGRSFIFNNVPTTVVGVMPARFRKLNADVYLPVVLDRSDARLAFRPFSFQAKLKPGVTIEQAEAELTVLAQRFSQIYPQSYPPKFFVKLVSWVENLVGPFRQMLYTLGAAVGLLLLIACSNVANLLLARGAAREKEMALRASLGASRSRLVRQLLVENVLIALGGVVIGCALAHLGTLAVNALIPRGPGSIPNEAHIRLSLPVLVFSVGLAGLTTLLFGLLPALQTARKDLIEPLKDARKGVGGGVARTSLRQGLVVLEVALSLVLLVGAGLLLRSFHQLTTTDLGFNSDRLLQADLTFPRERYQQTAEKQQYFRELLPKLQALPGVLSVTPLTTRPPFGGPVSEVDIPGKPRTPERWETLIELCGENYLPTHGARLIRGRFLSEIEVSDSRKVVVVNQAFATRYFGPEDPIGRQVTLKLFERPGPLHVEKPSFEIIGVVSDVKNQGIENPSMPHVYLPYAIVGAWDRGVRLRTAGDPHALVNALRQQIWSVDRSVAVNIDSVGRLLQQQAYARPQFNLFVLGVFAGVGLVLVVLGVYSVIAYFVSQRTHEIGVRMALGATRVDVLRLVMRKGLVMLGLGATVGLLASVNLTHLLAAKLEGPEWKNDPAALAAVLAVVLVAGCAACFFPARRATRVDPIVALRHE